MYKEALTKSGFNDDITYTSIIESNNSEGNNTKKRKIIWFNPPHSMNIETNIGKTFLKLIKKHFPPNNSFHKIFNKNTINKIGYGCMGNISLVIISHNKSILHPKAKYDCDCRNKESCPIQNQCLTPKVLYEATVVNYSDNENRYIYFGTSDTAFKERYHKHT